MHVTNRENQTHAPGRWYLMALSSKLLMQRADADPRGSSAGRRHPAGQLNLLAFPRL